MQIINSIKVVSDFKKENLRTEFKKIESSMKVPTELNCQILFDAAKHIKLISSSIDEIVHSSGILLAIPYWLNKGEEITYLSLGAGNHKHRFDLETDLSIAEFKFGKWNESGANGIRRRTYFGNYVSLLTTVDQNNRKKYFVIEDKSSFEKFLQSASEWRNVLSKNPTGLKKLENFLNKKGLNNLKTVAEIYDYFKNEIIIIDFEFAIK